MPTQRKAGCFLFFFSLQRFCHLIYVLFVNQSSEQFSFSSVATHSFQEKPQNNSIVIKKDDGINIKFLCSLQWLHTLRRRDQDNHRLHQQLLKFLQSKSSGGTGFIPAELEIQGSLAPRMAGSVPRRLSETPSRRKQWDRSPDDSRKYTCLPTVYIDSISHPSVNFLYMDVIGCQDDRSQVADGLRFFAKGTSVTPR